MERIRPSETATVVLVGALAVEVLLAVAALASLGHAPPEAFHRAMLGVAGVGVAAAVFAEVAAA